MCNKCDDNIVRKPVVFYKTDKKAILEVGMPAWIIPLNHNSDFVTNGRVARTSNIITKLPNGVFETLNTIYKPEEMQ